MHPTDDTLNTDHLAAIDSLVGRLAELQRNSAETANAQAAHISRLSNMLCTRQNQSKWLADHPTEEIALNSAYFGHLYYADANASTSPDDWMLWLVDDTLMPVTDKALISHWRKSLGLHDNAFSWGGSSEMPYIFLDQEPTIEDNLSAIPALVDSKGKAIECDPAPMPLNIEFKNAGDNVIGSLDIPPGLVHIGKSWTLSHQILRQMPISRAQLDFIRACIGDFPSSLTCEVLSILFSIAGDQASISWEGKQIHISTQPIKMQNTLVITAVSDDKTLHMKALPTIADFPPDLCERFTFTRYADVREDTIAVRPVVHDAPDPIKQLQEHIIASARTKKMARQLVSEGYSLTLPQELAEHFLFTQLPWLLANYKVLGADKLGAYKLRASSPKLNFKLGSGIDFLEGEATVEVGEEQFTLADLLAQFRKNKYVTLSDGDRVILDDAYIKRLQRIFRTGKSKKDAGVKVSFFDMAELEGLLDAPLQGEEFTKRKEAFSGLRTIASQRLRTPGLKGELRPYQKYGAKWLRYLYDNNLGGCLADDMGLGKTIQTISLLTATCARAKHPALIVMPRSLIFNWEEELRKFAPHLTVAQYYGTGRDLAEALKAQVILTTYAMVRNDIDRLKDTQFDLVVLDESQNIKNQTTHTTQAVWMLKAHHRLAISGTPIENNLDELYSLFRFLNPTMFGSYEAFRDSYTIPIQRDDDKQAAESLRRKIFPFILRRLKHDVLTDLPPRTDQTIYVEMSPAQAAHYEKRRAYYKQLIDSSVAKQGIGGSQMVLLQAMTELRRLASVPEALTDSRIKSAKLESLLDQLSAAISNGHKAVVFFNFLAGLELVSSYLTDHDIHHRTMTGSTADRSAVVDAFQNDPDCRVLLMTLKTGGVGLNLTAADTVFIFEPWWNKAAEEQAINRLHRIGQKASVACYSLIAKNTIEEKIQRLQEQKSLLVDDIISTDAGGMKHLTAEDIDFIFR